MTVKKIAVFKPINAMHNNAFGTGQYEIFKSINESKKYDVTFFLDNKDVYFSGTLSPYKRAARFGFYPDTIEVRARWLIEEVNLEIK